MNGKKTVKKADYLRRRENAQNSTDSQIASGMSGDSCREIKKKASTVAPKAMVPSRNLWHRIGKLLAPAFPIWHSQWKGRMILRYLIRRNKLTCAERKLERVVQGKTIEDPPTSRKAFNKFLQKVADGTITRRRIMDAAERSIGWWHEGVAVVAASYGSKGVPHGDLKDSVAAFTVYSNSVDERGQNAVKTLFAIAGAAAAMFAFSIPLMLEDKKRIAGSWGLAFGSIVLMANISWAMQARRILEAYYSLYVAGIIDSARKHAAFGLGKHQWLEYVYRELRKLPQTQRELNEQWIYSRDTLYYFYTQWVVAVGVMSLLVGLLVFVAALYFLYLDLPPTSEIWPYE